jgi:hypothetical protein
MSPIRMPGGAVSADCYHVRDGIVRRGTRDREHCHQRERAALRQLASGRRAETVLMLSSH